MVAYPDRGEGNDPELFFFFFFFFFLGGVGSLSQPRLNIFTVDNMGVMICLGQGGLRSLSASSSECFTGETRHIVPPCNEARISNFRLEFQISSKRYSSLSSYSIILKCLPEKLGIQCHPVT